MQDKNTIFPSVAADFCDSYEPSVLTELLKNQFVKIGVDESLVKGKKIAIKPNLVSAKDVSTAATTNPAVIEAAFNVLRELGAEDIILAESPGGPYSPVTLSYIYKVTGMKELSEKTSLKLNMDTSFRPEAFDGGKKLKKFDIITPIADCDVIVNICKLKTHSLTGLSCAVKNLFGVIPGTMKFEMHAAYSQLSDFSEMLVDLNLTLMSSKTIISICDGIISMEGNGPTNGTPVKTDILLSSQNTFALDIVAEKFIGTPGETLYLDYGAERLGISRQSPDDILPKANDSHVLERPDSKAGGLLRNLPNYFGGSVARFFEPKPKVNNDRCIGCGKCVGYCPQETIKIIQKKGKPKAKINYKKCIRCYCCQELCPIGAVDTVKNLLLKLVH